MPNRKKEKGTANQIAKAAIKLSAAAYWRWRFAWRKALNG